jgi:integrase/recombinase XerD
MKQRPLQGHAYCRTVRQRPVKADAERAGVNPVASVHWLRHAHASHAIDGGATLPEVQKTLGHGSVATTSGYLHARPGSSSGLRLDEGVFLR